MNNRMIKLLDTYLGKLPDINDRSGLKELEELKKEILSENDDDTELSFKKKLFDSAAELMYWRERANELKGKKLSGSEKQELEKVKNLIDNNLFTYYFQPIVRADTGEIYSYEALMRAKDQKDVTPFHILKYAELTGRLAEIEQYTFLNILEFISNNRASLGERLVFINSMPSIKVPPEILNRIDTAIERLSDMVVVEMTEQSEFNDRDLNEVKERFHRLGVPIAVDDYGTGYSNVSNLLRYTPNYVKIDRMLLTGIQDNPNKKHFVREIIDFCHENDILALAEGVETYEELHTVILLGADLIQGFYTAKPSPEVIDSLPYDIRSEIRACAAERETGRLMKSYAADAGERVSLDRLTRDEYTCIVIGGSYTDAAVTAAGSSSRDSQIHIETADDFKGKVILDFAHLSNVLGEPCIDIGEHNDVTIVINGENRLKNGGIRVPESSRVVFEGEGELHIDLGNCDYYGIGNDLSSAHGELVFDLDAAVRISSSSHSGVCIGSGLGGRIDIRRGVYVLEAHGSSGVCVGSFDGKTDISIYNCDLEAKAAGARNAVIGSLNSDTDINVKASSLRCSGYSQLVSAFGSVSGSCAYIDIENSSIKIVLRGQEITACGSLTGSSDVTVKGCTFRADCDGTESLLFGGMAGGTKLLISEADAQMKLSTSLGKCIIAPDEDINVQNCMCSVTIGGDVFNRIVN